MHFVLPLDEAAAHLGMGSTVLKRLCRQLGVERWPYRVVCCLQGIIEDMQVSRNFEVPRCTCVLVRT